MKVAVAVVPDRHHPIPKAISGKLKEKRKKKHSHTFDLLTIPLFYSLFILGAAIIIFMYETGYKRKTIQEIEESEIYG